jgi:two-component system capsular synthesis sensor histidine kinase RcsC
MRPKAQLLSAFSFELSAPSGVNIACVRRMGPEGRVLVVDDEPAIRALVAKIVERAGFPVDVARDGADAIELLDGHEYAVVVVDLMMPNVDGYALIDYLKKRKDERPAIIVISAGEPGALRQLDGSMVHSIVRKPFDIDVLGDLITAAARSMRGETAAGGDVLQFPRENVC